MKPIYIAFTVMLISLCGCNHKSSPQSTLPDFPEAPSREAYEGFTWEKISGAGLQFWAQLNPSIHVATNETLPGACIEYSGDDGKTYSRAVIQIFPLKNSKIEDLLAQLKYTQRQDEYEVWNDKDTCAFKPIPSNREGVKRYILTPTGKAEEELQERGRQEPICTTCGGWGIGNSGMRYFEIHASHPNLALFIEIGQEAPLFDENSIVFTSSEFSFTAPKEPDKTVKGKLVIGHEVRSFTASGDTTAYWIVDKTGALKKEYELVVGVNSQPYTPVYVELKVRDKGKSDDGFAADYASVYEVIEIMKVGKLQ